MSRSSDQRLSYSLSAPLALFCCLMHCAPGAAITCATRDTHLSPASSVSCFASSHNLDGHPCSIPVFLRLRLALMISFNGMSGSLARLSWASFLVSLATGCVCFCLAQQS